MNDAHTFTLNGEISKLYFCNKNAYKIEDVIRYYVMGFMLS